ncbi:MAG TPA: phosphohistidine phosphatase SixA [Candidatus Caenarcaniphilales bacterium]
MSTQLYLIRHAIAAEQQEYASDQERPLSAEGETKARQVARRLRRLKLSFDLVLTSPLVRARQTAEIFQSEGLSSHLRESTFLEPQGSFDQWLTWLEQWRPAEPVSLALVGHQPDLGQWSETLLWGEAKQVFILKKAGIIGLSLPTIGPIVGNSRLFWLTPPRFLI